AAAEAGRSFSINTKLKLRSTCCRYQPSGKQSRVTGQLCYQEKAAPSAAERHRDDNRQKQLEKTKGCTPPSSPRPCQIRTTIEPLWGLGSLSRCTLFLKMFSL